MKSLIVFTQRNDTFYIDYDVEFADYIIKRAKSGGLVEEDSDITQLDANLVMQLFSPLVLSQLLLIDQTKEPCSTVQCLSGFIFAFRHTDDLLYIAVNGDGTESEKFLHRKIQVFMTVLRFMFGPAGEEMTISNSSNKKEKWTFLRQFMQSWSELVHSEQAFLVEAIERVHVNQMVNEKCMDVLLKSVKQFQFTREQPVHHALLLVNSKLLALYSNRSAHELQPKDILMAMILSKTLYPQEDKLEDLFSKFYITDKSQLEAASAADDISDAGDDEYHSAPNTPRSHRSKSPTTSHKSETVEGLTLSDEDSQVEKSGDHLTLLDMFMKKCPDVVLQSATVEKVTEKEQLSQVINKNSHAVSVEAIVHQAPDLSGRQVLHEASDGHSSDEGPVSTSQENVKAFDFNDSMIKGKPEITDDERKQRNVSSSVSVKKDSEDQVSTLATGDNENLGSDLSGSLPPAVELESSLKHQDNTDVPVTPSAAVSDAQLSSADQQCNVALKSTGISLLHHIQRQIIAASHTETYPCCTTNRGMSFNLPVKAKATAESSSVTPETSSSASAVSSTDGIYLPQMVFLETPTCLYSPYSLHAIQIAPGLTFLLLSQAPRYLLADSLYQVIQTMQDVLHGRRSKLPRSRSIYVYETIHTQLGKIYNVLKKVKGRVKNLIYDVLVRWEKDDLKQKMLDFLERDTSFRIPPELESPLVEFYKKLRELFSHLFLLSVPYSPQLLELLTLIRDRLRSELLDYREYLNVKAQRNITMTSYIDEFPGLIHFVFIDRHFHQMTAPSMNISLREGEHMDATSYLKEKIWTMYQLMMSKLTEGYTTVMMRDGDFYFSYFLWFEDQTGNPLPVQESYKPSRKQPYPGILCGSFY
ncbi:unnamed protein product, partial [Candidula unifasciata]